jgi:putative transposase
MVTSDGEKNNHPRFLRKAQKLQARRQRVYSRRLQRLIDKNTINGQLDKIQLRTDIDNAKNLADARLRSARISEKVANQRKDYTFQQARKLTNKFDVIVFENINLQDLSRTLKFGKSISDLGFGMFRTRVEQICNETGKIFVKADKWFPSSKTCSTCGFHKKDLTLKDQEWTCTNCHTHHDRDINAAINLKTYFSTAGTAGIYAHGDYSSTGSSLELATTVDEVGKNLPVMARSPRL